MAQTRYYNFLADDYTGDINRWLLGILQPGVYRGFEFSPTNNLTLTLVHTDTGIVITDPDGVPGDPTGVLLTRHGVVIKEDEAIEIPVNATTTHPRIDLIVCTHEYVETEGGAVATYSVIQGVASATPAAPALTFPEKQVTIATLYIPAATSVLDAAGVIYAREEVPFLGNQDKGFAFRDEANNFTKENIFSLLRLIDWQATTYDSGTKTLTLPATGNLFIAPTLESNAIENIVGRTEPGTVIYIYFPTSADINSNLSYINSPGNIEVDALTNIQTGDLFTFVSYLDDAILKWRYLSARYGDNVRVSAPTFFRKQVSLGQGGTATFSSANKTLNLNGGGNFYKANLGNNGIIAYLKATGVYSIIKIRITSGFGSIEVGAGSVPAGYKNIDILPDNIGLMLKAGDTIELYEDLSFYRLLSVGARGDRSFNLQQIDLNNI
jgi:hypothetical protein